MKHRKGMSERLSHAVDLLDAPLLGQTLLELLDDSRVLIENHNGVMEYSNQKIQVRVRYGSLCICGVGLRLSKMSADQLVISGCITSITVVRGGKNGDK